MKLWFSFFTAISGLISYFDIAYYGIPYKLIYSLVLSIPIFYLDGHTSSLESIMIIGVITQIIFAIRRFRVQMADVIILHIVSLFLRSDMIIIFLSLLTIISGSFSLLWLKLYNSKRFPFSPCILLSTIVSVWIQFKGSMFDA